MNVVIPALDINCPASLAIRREGIDHQTIIMHDDYSYAGLMARMWQWGQGFIVLEHDVIPWPGAIDELKECRKKWCAYEYPRGPGTLYWALGCMKFSAELIERQPSIHQRWIDVPWNQLDAAIITNIDKSEPHFHDPPLAHLATL